MDKTTYPGSGTGVDDVCDYHSMVGPELDFVNHWLNATVQDEVLQGSKLREEKQRINPYPCQTECDVLNIEYIKRPCQGHKKIAGRSKCKPSACTSPKSCSQRNRYCSPSSYSYRMQHCYTSPHSCSVKTRSPPRCSLRIAELAVPSKRQCIDTWRYKCDILPACMVERLRQQVMDEQPIAQITDAINCFKRRKPKTLKRPKKLSRESKMKYDNLAELRKLCALFGNKLAQRLLTPKNLKLNPQLQKISNIVADEIANMMKRRKANINNLDDKMHTEISEKIAVWIATVLEDTSYKLLEDDLRELEEDEGPVLDFIDDLFDNVMMICNPQVDEFEEHGDYSEITSETIGEQYDRKSESPDSLENNEIDTSPLYTNMTYDTENMTKNENSDLELEDLGESSTPISSKDHLLEKVTADIPEEITTNMESTTGDDSTENEPIDNDESTVKNKSSKDSTENEQIDNDESTVKNKSSKDSTENEQINDESTVKNKASKEELINDDDVFKEKTGNGEVSDETENKLEQEPDETDTTYLPDNSEQLVLPRDSELIPIEDVTLDSDSSSEIKADNGQTKDLEGPKPDSVSDEFEIFAEESSNEENKIVKFSDIDLGGGLKSSLAGSNKPKHSLGDSKASFTFAPPNEKLLSDADESWPEDIATPVIKPTTSIIKSITSLGKIVENEERLSMVTDEVIFNQKPDIPDTNKIHEQRTKDTKESNLETLSSKKIYQERQDSIGGEIETIIMTQKMDIQNEGNISGKVTEKVLTDLQMEKSHEMIDSASGSSPSLNEYHNKSSQWDVKKSKNANDEISEPNILHATSEITLEHATSKTMFDYKVHSSTAPPWVRHNNGKGEPSEYSLGGGYIGNINEDEIHIWCKDMDRMFTNLDLWNRWLGAVCKDMLRLNKQREMYKMCDPNLHKKIVKEWLKLKRNVDKDAVLWTRLSQRDHGQLKKYKEKGMHIVSTKYCMLCNCRNNYKAKEKS